MPSLVQNIWDSVAGRDTDAPEVMQRANEFETWAKSPYHTVFLDWLYDQADRPVPISDKHMDLIVGTARVNTFKEIRRYLVDEEAKANRLLNRENNG